MQIPLIIAKTVFLMIFGFVNIGEIVKIKTFLQEPFFV
jgi:hypothetical protein